MRQPVGHRIVSRDARRLKNFLPQFCDGLVHRLAGEHQLRPLRRRRRHDRPIDLVPRDQLHRGLGSLRRRHVRPRHLRRILPCEQRRVRPRNRHPRRAILKGSRNPVLQPHWRIVETRIRRMFKSRQHTRIIGKQRRHQHCPGAVRMIGNPPHQRQRLNRRGQHQFLPRAQSQPHAHGHLGQPVKLFIEGQRSKRRRGDDSGSTHTYRLSARASRRNSTSFAAGSHPKSDRQHRRQSVLSLCHAYSFSHTSRKS